MSGLERAARKSQALLTRTILPPGIGDAGNQPFAVCADKVEQVRAAVVDLAVHQEIEWGPDHGQIVIDAHQRIVNALLDLALPGLPTASAKASNVIWVGLPSRISTMPPPGSNGFLIAAASRFAMPSNIAVIGAMTACSSGVTAGVTA